MFKLSLKIPQTEQTHTLTKDITNQTISTPNSSHVPKCSEATQPHLTFSAPDFSPNLVRPQYGAPLETSVSFVPQQLLCHRHPTHHFPQNLQMTKCIMQSLERMAQSKRSTRNTLC